MSDAQDLNGGRRHSARLEILTQSYLCRGSRHNFDTVLNKIYNFQADRLQQKQDQLDRLPMMIWSLDALRPMASNTIALKAWRQLALTVWFFLRPKMAGVDVSQ